MAMGMQNNHPILITGTSTGIGYQLAHDLHALGYRVFAGVRQQADRIRLSQEGLEAILLDINSETSIQEALADILTRTQGRLYGLINNAGFGQIGAIEDLSRDLIRQQFETNVFGPMSLIAHVLPVMREQGKGRIIQLSSLLGFIAMKYRGAYCASKYALEGFTDTLRLELNDLPIYVSLIQPGPIESQFRNNAYQACLSGIDITHSRHQQTYQNMKTHYAQYRTSQNSPPPRIAFQQKPTAITLKVRHALESKNPRARYPVTLPTYLFKILTRILPTGLLDQILCQLTAQETE
jgi:short-subunit dehydrogenase